nr:Com family DNA-binding transcriptional regulator [Clostridium neonatale]DAW06021.1 MAG TPA: 50S ribosomal subunit [Caudoviricetes sp.]
MKEYRCPICNQLLLRGYIKDSNIEVKCCRCKKIINIEDNKIEQIATIK